MRKWLLTAAVAALFPSALADYGILNDFTTYQNGTMPDGQTYITTNITSPVFNYNTWREDLCISDASSHILLTLNYNNGASAGPYIFRDDDLSLVYANPSFNYAINARIQTVAGELYLTFWHGAQNRGDSQGYCVFYDTHYRLRWNVTTGPPLAVGADMHECEVTADDTVLLTAYQDRAFDLSSIGGREDDILADSCFQEVDLRNGSVVFTWCASDHLSPDLTFWNYTMSSGRGRQQNQDGSGGDTSRKRAYATSSGFDAYHVNSLQKTHEGNYLISLRNLNSIVYVDGKSGMPIWNLNGKLNNFTDVTPPPYLAQSPEDEGPEGAMALGFAWQHDVRFWDDGLTQITLFDNHKLSTSVNCTDSHCSRGLHLRTDTGDPDNLLVQVLRSYRSSQGLKSVVFGSMHPLPYPSDTSSSDLDAFLIGWGVNAEFSEYTSEGELIRDVQYSPLYPGHSVGGRGVQSSRVYKQSWHGYPTWPPTIASNGNGTLWVSWNGATEVHAWAVYDGDDKASLTVVDPFTPYLTMKRAGFETKIELGKDVRSFVKVGALDDQGRITGATEVVKLGYRPLSQSRFGYYVQNVISFIELSKLLV
ncbi:hypothetical protein LTR37_008220 [Vermiconidia calcicola]|uniref:Uncharacterized protein n=1 Tax=Vermiconidia calcicola TaxID=1690605 RepID=A0ACC3NBU4_9PEZI|nr:hypothetical protein LTR37_008220 [Vermiconidia calcicola]